VLRGGLKAALLMLVVIGVAMLTNSFWTASIASSLVCAEELGASDAMLIENFDPNYLLFERAAGLEKAGLARMTFVPVEASSDSRIANPVSVGIAEVMARQARLRTWRQIIVTQREPISLNAALQIRDRLAAEKIKSIIVIAPAFRSRRSSLVYQTTLGAAGITVHCVPVPGRTAVQTWTHTWHGIQQVCEELLKFQYYRFYVIPFMPRRA